jgi:hypothetical protein
MHRLNLLRILIGRARAADAAAARFVEVHAEPLHALLQRRKPERSAEAADVAHGAGFEALRAARRSEHAPEASDVVSAFMTTPRGSPIPGSVPGSVPGSAGRATPSPAPGGARAGSPLAGSGSASASAGASPTPGAAAAAAGSRPGVLDLSPAIKIAQSEVQSPTSFSRTERSDRSASEREGPPRLSGRGHEKQFSPAAPTTATDPMEV